MQNRYLCSLSLSLKDLAPTLNTWKYETVAAGHQLRISSLGSSTSTRDFIWRNWTIFQVSSSRIVVNMVVVVVLQSTVNIKHVLGMVFTLLSLLQGIVYVRRIFFKTWTRQDHRLAKWFIKHLVKMPHKGNLQLKTGQTLATLPACLPLSHYSTQNTSTGRPALHNNK